MIPELSWGSDFAGLERYLVRGRDFELLDLHQVSSLQTAAEEMRVVARGSERVRTPVMHVSFSAALEDGRLERPTWLALVEEAEREFGLDGHLRIVVRHRDKDYDHIHVMWCTIHPDTGRTPPHQLFRRRESPLPEWGTRALTEAQLLHVPAEQRARGSFSRFALLRLMAVSRAFEEQFKLRRLRTPREVADARDSGEVRPARNGARRRGERTGMTPVIDRGGAIRCALDAPSWWEARKRLNDCGLDLEPKIRMLKDGTEQVRGIVIFDVADPSNRAPASDFDLAHIKYGMRQVERRQAAGALPIEQWWREQKGHAPVFREETQWTPAQRGYAEARAAHRRAEAERAERRKYLLVRHTRERARRRSRLMRLRRLRAERLPKAQRRAFYSLFAQTTRARIWWALEARQRGERAMFSRIRMPSWAAFQATFAKIQNARQHPSALPTAVPSGALNKFKAPPTQFRPDKPEETISVATERDDELLAALVRARGRHRD